MINHSKPPHARKLAALLLVTLGSIASLHAATWYVDGSATGSKNGTSWANAWTSLPASGVAAGDTVYISGGASGSTQTYNMSTYWIPCNGTAGNRITYQIGQDSAHNGTAIFNHGGGVVFATGANYVNLVGDAGDGKMHFKTKGYNGLDFISNFNNFRLAYFDCSDGINVVGNFQGLGAGIEIDHSSFNITDLSADHGIQLLGCTGTKYDDVQFHHNYLRIPHIGPGVGADGVQATGNGYSIYNNTIEGYNAAYTGGQHQDGWQSTGGDSYVKIYSNIFLNVSNYAAYGDAYFGGFQHLRCYNNIAEYTDSNLNKGSGGGFIFGTDGGYVGPSPCTFNDVVIANNTVVDYNWGNSTAGACLNNGTSYATTFTNCYAVNNLFVNGTSTFGSQGNTTSTFSNNVAISAANAANIFTTYTTYGGLNNDYHLKSSASSVIGQAVNLTSYFTTDKDGNLRIASGGWDAGAYAYNTSSVAAVAPSGATVSISVH